MLILNFTFSHELGREQQMTGKVMECWEHFTDKQVHWSQVIQFHDWI